MAVLEPEIKETVEEPKKIVVSSTVTPSELEEQIAIETKLGISPSREVLKSKLLKCIEDEGINVYPRSQVVKYLDEKLGNTWVWMGLRKVDSEHLGERWVSHQEPARDVSFSDEVYSETIPLPVLLTVEKISKAVPEVHFYVSSLPEPKGDPFLFVTCQKIGGYVVEKWDEPGFRRK